MIPLPKLAVHEISSGGGLPIVLLHPFPFDHRAWVPVARALPSSMRALGVDLPGQGYSEFGSIPPRVDFAADAVYESLLRKGVANAIVAGTSMGGYVALALAARHPGFVSGLGLVSTKSTPDDAKARARRLRIAAEMEMNSTLKPVLAMPTQLLGEASLTERRELLPLLEAWVHSQSPRGLAWALRMMAGRPDTTGVLSEFERPIAIVVGDQDRITPCSDAQHMLDAAPNASITVVAQAGHLVGLEDPRAVAGALALLHRRVMKRTVDSLG